MYGRYGVLFKFMAGMHGSQGLTRDNYDPFGFGDLFDPRPADQSPAVNRLLLYGNDSKKSRDSDHLCNWQTTMTAVTSLTHYYGFVVNAYSVRRTFDDVTLRFVEEGSKVFPRTLEVTILGDFGTPLYISGTAEAIETTNFARRLKTMGTILKMQN